MNQPDPMEFLAVLMNRAQTLEIIGRTQAKAKRGAHLRPWAMGVGRNLVDANSSLGRDDAEFMADYTGDMVSATAVYPIMNAIDSITAIAELIDGRTKSGDSHASSLLTLCRMATESAATTIWLLSNTDRDMRRGLSVRFTASELNAQRGYQSSTRKYFEHGSLGKRSVEYQQFLEHVRLFDERVVMLERGMQETPNAKVKGSGDVVIAAAKWLDGHPPLHDGDAGPYGRPFGFEDVAKSFYNVSSAIVHGLKWPLDYMPSGEVDLSRMIVEGVNNAVSMAECAVALFEAQAQSWETETDRPILYPDSLQPTIEDWADLYPV
ncbi:hypothetical protein [Mycobacterium deserti]|uniref:Uncharacterized protein n=1 Tax=Mycobacterium deserti TaxID=2978347 RepID=A0ABT2M3J9_9MYCO|nr:hypothetical protein [Mycobacterium deserti]MCT7656839.1 hypothetical protein [Mycobacterium deserti]